VPQQAVPHASDAAVVAAAATYFPSCATATRRGSIIVGNGDEDAITLAVSAGLDAAAQAPRRIGALFVALGHSPLQAGPVAEIVREALGLPAGVGCATALEDELGGLTALLSAIDQVTLGRTESALVVAAEGGDGRSVGASAVALLVESPAAGGGIAVTGIRSEGSVVYGTWPDGDGGTGRADRRFLDASLTGAVRRLMGESHADIAGAGALAVSGAWPAAVRDDLPADLPSAAVGDCGVTGPVLALLAGARLAGSRPAGARSFLTLCTSPGRTALLRASVSGGAGWLPETSAPDLTRAAPEPAASPVLSLPTSSPFFARSAREMLRLEAGKCDACGHVAFPPSQRPVCAACGGSSWTPHRLSREGAVYTFTVNHFLPAGFGEQMVMILGEMTDGSRYWAPASGIAGDQVSIGMPVELRVRRFTQDGGVPAYAMKFTPPRRAAVAGTSG
jgi:uncharacterized OB-fold protein